MRVLIQVTKTAQSDDTMLAMNEALMLGSLRQHELTEAAELLNVQLQKEIAERKRTEALLSCQKQAFEMVAVGKPLMEVLEFLVRETERQSSQQLLVAVHLLDQSGTRFEHTVAPSLPPEYSQAVDGMAVSSATGSCCAAVAQRRRVVVPDIANSKEWPGFAAFALPLGLRAAWSTPVFSSSGKTLGTFVSYCREVCEPDSQAEALGEIVTRTAAVVIERKEAEEKLRESEERFRAIAENIPQLAWMADRDGFVDWFNRGWLEYTGTTLQENQGVGWKAVHHPDHVDAVAEKFERHLREGRDWEDTFPLRGKDGNYRWFLSRMNVIRDKSGKVMRFFGTNTDITNERNAEERQLLLTNELAHRGKNLLAVILSITARSLSGAQPPAEERDVLIQRLHALGRSQSVLITGGFEGAFLTEIVNLEVETFSDRVKAVGPDIMLNPRVTQTFALLVHELATNAAKHGALSVPAGRIAIHWSIEGAGADARFRFQWQEFDGPPVVPPTREGFGRILLEKAAAQEFGVPPKVSFAPEGLRYEIDALLSAVTATSAGGGRWQLSSQARDRPKPIMC